MKGVLGKVYKAPGGRRVELCVSQLCWTFCPRVLTHCKSLLQADSPRLGWGGGMGSTLLKTVR